MEENSDPRCERARLALHDRKVQFNNVFPGAPDFYFPKSIIVEFFRGLSAKDIFLCECGNCKRYSRAEYGTDNRIDQIVNIERRLLEDYLLIYALLIYHKRPTLIGRFIQEEVRLDGDRFLNAIDLAFLSTLNDATFLQDSILRDQWRFQIRPLVMSPQAMVYQSKEVVPIEEDSDPIGSGQFGSVYKSSFPYPEYQRIWMKEQKLPFFARKVFARHNFSFARKEWKALLHINQKYHPHFIQALGAFIHGDTFSILFLYAESTLEILLMQDFAGFASELIWKQILGITEALECLHNDDPVTIHSDIKPQNIFLHGKTLKLADFGSSRLIHGIKSTENQDFWAGRVYSPPELNVRFPAYDIWSLGCVMSEVATSDAQKRNSLIEYRSERTQEDEDIVNWSCFHKNKMMKAAVRERHKILLNLVQQNKDGDGEELSSWQMRFYTRDFFDLVEQMLGFEDQRPSASEVVKQLRHFINQASDDQESTGQPDVWQRSWAGTIPTSHLSHYRRLCAKFGDASDKCEKKCALYFYRHGNPPLVILKRYHIDEQTQEIPHDTFLIHRDEYSTQTRISTANEIVQFYTCQTRPTTITLVFRDRHTDHYSFRSLSDTFNFQAALTGYSVHECLSFEVSSFWFDMKKPYIGWLPFVKRDSFRITHTRAQIWTDRNATGKPRMNSRPFVMRIAITQASKLFLICISDNTQRPVTASNTDLRLYKVSVREMDVTHGIPTDLSKTSSYDADQEVQLEFATKENLDDFLGEFNAVFDEWESSRRKARMNNQDLE